MDRGAVVGGENGVEVQSATVNPRLFLAATMRTRTEAAVAVTVVAAACYCWVRCQCSGGLRISGIVYGTINLNG